MTREIKFRAWLTGPGRMIKWVELQKDYGVRQAFQFDTLMQYTGLKDKNGREIYEGDVIWYGLNITGGKYMGKVVFDEAGFNLKSPLSSELLPLYGADEIKVIGNIYENGDLLNGKS